MRWRGIVIHGANNYGTDTGKSSTQIFAARIVQILHFAGVAAREPLGKMAKLFEFGGGRDATKIKSDGASAFAKARSSGKIKHRTMMQHFLR